MLRMIWKATLYATVPAQSTRKTDHGLTRHRSRPIRAPLYYQTVKRLPTDLETLREIYERYYADFSSFSREDPKRTTKVYVPIDIETIATHFGVDADIVLGRLY